MLSMIYIRRSLNVTRYSKLFIHYFNAYSKVNSYAIMDWRIKVCASYLMLHDIDGLQVSMQNYNETQEKIIKENGLDKLGLRIIKDNIFEYYNVHAYLDTHIKAMQLGWQPDVKLVLLLRPNMPILNPVMLEYWKQYITVIEDIEAVKQLSYLRKYLEIDIGMAASLNGKAIYIEHAKSIVQKEWEKQGRKPLFELNEKDKEFGREQLVDIGIPEDAWFISLHVRDAGYKTGSYLNDESFDSYRNADIETYKLAIEEVVKRGGYVIRVGDPQMKPIDDIEGLFDYAHSDIRSNRMDIFLFSQCRFFIGVSSGPVLTPILFGVPVVMSNFVPMSGRPHSNNCLFIPKLLRLNNEGRYASIEDVLASDIGRIFSSEGYAERNIDVIDNSPEYIRDVVIEMFERQDSDFHYTDEDEERQTKVTELYREYSGYGDMGRMGNAFLRECANQKLI